MPDGDGWIHRTLPLVVLVVLLALAGCSGAPGESSRTVTDTIEATPSTTPTDTDPVDYDRAPPGIDESGVDERVLLRSHFGELRNRSNTITIRQTQRSGNRSSTASRVVRSAGSQATVANVYPTRPVRSVAWTDGTTTARRFDAAGSDPGTRFQYNSSRVQVQEASAQRRVVGLLTGTNVTPVATVTRNGTTVTILESVGRPENRTLQQLLGTTDVSRFHVRVAATQGGRIAALTWNATVGPPSRAVRVEFQYAVTAVGTTTVARPDWVGTARSRATRLAASVENASSLRVEHRGGDPVPADAVVRWRSGLRGRAATTSLGVRLEANDTVYASVVNGSIRFASDPPAPGTAERLDRGLFLEFATERGLPIGSVYGFPAQPAPNGTTPSTDSSTPSADS